MPSRDSDQRVVWVPWEDPGQGTGFLNHPPQNLSCYGCRTSAPITSLWPSTLTGPIFQLFRRVVCMRVSVFMHMHIARTMCSPYIQTGNSEGGDRISYFHVRLRCPFSSSCSFLVSLERSQSPEIIPQALANPPTGKGSLLLGKWAYSCLGARNL